MTLKLHNTLTGNIDEFIPQHGNKVLFYSCGPTVYNYLHIGNWSAYIYWDTLVRILIADGYEVDRVINITDVGHLTSDADDGEDKLEKGAHRENKTAQEIAKFYTDDFINGMKQLNLIMPQHLAKATDYIPQQLDLIRKLKQKGFTYQINDGIYFDTSKFPTYANFAHLNLNELKAGVRVKFNPEKRNHSDFALWKFTLNNEKRDMEWETPTDILDNITDEKIMGFPGWHLECSAMALSILGQTIDIHTGGIDHIPIHHSNEIAQSEASTGVKFSNYWLHNNHLKVNGTKISKSLNNGYTLADLAKKGFSPLDFRMFVLQGNYRNEGNFTFENLQSAQNRLRNWLNIAVIRHQINDTIENDNDKIKGNKTVLLFATSQAIIEAANNDIGTPQVLSIIDDAFSKIENASLININRHAFVHLLETIDDILGLQLIDQTPDITDDIKKIILERNQARDQKDWSRSDELRNELTKLNINIRDNKKDSVWSYIHQNN
ncbi:MAG: cysteinyl-tRNA synthetase [Patescibacteria group bacterium]|nr:cysteinyl-tRNA synthetase [Patescibacteria group bacterium]